MAIGIQGCFNQICHLHGLAAPRSQKSAKNVENDRFLTFLAVASQQTAEHTTSGRTSAEPAWARQ